MSDKCDAKTRSGTPCTRTAGYGTTHLGVGRCKNHGGASPQAELGGQVELARREAAVMGRPLDIDPYEAILECIRIAAGEVKYASERVAALDKPMVPTMFGPQLDAWIIARQRMLDRVEKYCVDALKAGVEERMVSVAERWERQIAELCQDLARRFGRDPADPEVKEAIRASLTLIAGGAATA